MKIGVISDTHDYFDPQIPGFFSGVDHIVHAGDVGQPGILKRLQEIAPVTAVSGNTDDPGFRYPPVQSVELADHKVFVQHIVDPARFESQLRAASRSERPDIVVFGHTHKPYHEFHDGTLLFNPGYAGKSRFGMPRTVAVLFCDEDTPRWEFFQL